jgi:hypothetical protein
LAFFIIDANRFDLFLSANVVNDLIDIIPGIQHHGVMGAESYGIGQSVGSGHNISHELFFLIIDIKISPGGNGNKQGQANG